MNQESSSKNAQFFWSLLKPFKFKISMLGVIGFIWSVFTVVKSYVLKVMIDGLASNGLSGLGPAIFIYFLSWFITEGVYRLRDYIIMYLKPYLKKHIIISVTKRLLTYDDHYFMQNRPSSIMTGVRNLYDGVDDGIYIVEELFSHFILIISAVISMFMINKYFSLITLIWFLVWAVLAYFWARNGHVLAYYINEARTKLSFNLDDIFTNILTVKTFNSEKAEENLAQDIANTGAKIEFKREKMFLKIWVMQGVLFFLVSGFAFYGLIQGYKEGKVTVGDFAMLIDLLHSVYLYLFDFAKDVSEFSEVTGKVKQGLQIVCKEVVNKCTFGNKDLKAHEGKIVFDKIHYQYPDSDDADPAVSSKKTITIPGGASVALIGASGSGKTTFMKLLLRLIEPDSGKITIDDQNIADCSLESLLKIFALIPQDYGLFHRSIKENIRYGMPEASDQEVIEAAKKARIHDYIQTLPYKYDTVYGSEIGLSGGQKQRVIIARGLLRNAKIFLFDESTSALDMQTEHDVFKNIQETTRGSTKLIIAHRLSTIKNVDLILVCDKGEIIESGTHEELIKKRGKYYSLLNVA